MVNLVSNGLIETTYEIKKDEGVQELADYLIEQVKAYQKN